MIELVIFSLLNFGWLVEIKGGLRKILTTFSAGNTHLNSDGGHIMYHRPPDLTGLNFEQGYFEKEKKVCFMRSASDS